MRFTTGVGSLGRPYRCCRFCLALTATAAGGAKQSGLGIRARSRAVKTAAVARLSDAHRFAANRDGIQGKALRMRCIRSASDGSVGKRGDAGLCPAEDERMHVVG